MSVIVLHKCTPFPAIARWEKCTPFPAIARWETLVLFRTCRLAGTHSVDGHSCSHNRLLLNKSFQILFLHSKCFGIDT